MNTRRLGPLGTFVAAYGGFAAARFLLPHEGALARGLSLAMLGVMIGSVRWAQYRQDEVMRAVAARANELGFWAGFLTLYVGAAFGLIRPGSPIWTVPLIVWIGSYGWFLWRLR